MLICCSCTRYSESIKEIYIVPKNPIGFSHGSFSVKYFGKKYGNGDVPTKRMMYMKIQKVIVDKKPNNCIACPLIRLNLCGKEVVVKPDSSGAYVDKVPDKRCLLRTR